MSFTGSGLVGKGRRKDSFCDDVATLWEKQGPKKNTQKQKEVGQFPVAGVYALLRANAIAEEFADDDTDKTRPCGDARGGGERCGQSACMEENRILYALMTMRMRVYRPRMTAFVGGCCLSEEQLLRAATLSLSAHPKKYKTK